MRRDWIEKGKRVFRDQGLAGVALAFLRQLAAGNILLSPGPVGDSWTEYMTWLAFANPGMLMRGNVDCFDYAIRNLTSPAPIVEIGSFCGLSTNMIAYLAQRYQVRNPVITCDKWIFEGATDGGMLGDSKTITHAHYRDFVKESFLRNIRMFSGDRLPYAIEAFSDEFFHSWAASEKCRDVFGREIRLGGAIAFAYIDGNHSYEFARRDFENCDRFLERGGFLLLDDSFDGSDFGVNRVVREASATRRYELVAKKPNYFFRKK